LAFPARYRGLATTLNLAVYDSGALVGSPMCGGLIWLAERNGWPVYPTMFACVATFLGLCGLVYALWEGRRLREG
jgi:hypothetical protein